MAEIIVDTGKLQTYVGQLKQLGKRLKSVDGRIDTLYGSCGLYDLRALGRANTLTKAANVLQKKEAGYLSEVIRAFEDVETTLSRLDPLDFKMPVESIGASDVKRIAKKAVKKYFDAVKKAAEVGIKLMTPSGRREIGRAVVKKASQIVSSVAQNYYEKGWIYKTVQYGKAVVKVASGVAKVAAGVGSMIGSGGLSTPVAVLSIISGCNDIYNGIMDGKATYTEQYDQIGKNLLKDTLVKSGGEIGEYFGSKKTGEIIGAVTYYGADLIPSIASFQLSVDKLKQADPTNLPQLWKEAKQIGQFDVGKIMTTDIDVLRYEIKLASYEFSATTNFIQNMITIKDVAGDAADVIEGVNNIRTTVVPSELGTAAG